MKMKYLLLAAAFTFPLPAFAQDAAPADQKSEAEAAKPAAKAFTTGVARGRDLLDSAISTSSLEETEIQKFSPRSVSEIFRNIPGMRSEAYGGEGYGNISIRGLPIALGGAKFLQLQEDGLPVLEFGDIAFGTADQFMRADLTLSQVQAIRGGSASTFASNSPGGIINFISKTDGEGGAVQLTAGLDYESYRMDFDYGAKISDTLRFNIGGFYRQGEGPRATGYDGYKGGQLKFNITKDFEGGYFRLYGKFLDDKSPQYQATPIRVTGTASDPNYEPVANFDPRKDTMLSRYLGSNVTMSKNNQLTRYDMTDGMHSKVKSIGGEAQFEVGEWTVTERFRYADISGASRGVYLAPSLTGPASGIASIWLRGPGGVFSYANGPLAGQTIANPAALNGNGLVASATLFDTDLDDLTNVTNDIRVSRVWDIGEGKLTTTAGFYKAAQTIDSTWHWSSVFMEVKGDGQAALLNLSTPTGVQVTQDGYFGFGTSFLGNVRRNIYDTQYSVNAPYASVNYNIGKLSLGGSIRYDFGTARGQLFGSVDLGRPASVISYDVNNNGTIPAGGAETRVAVYPLTTPAPVHYDYDYVSYSLSANYRIADTLSVFGRFSRGGRANADRILFSPYVSPVTGELIRKDAAYDPVTQAEGGVKYRSDNAELYVTGFWAKTKEHNIGLDRSYRAYGVELEGSVRQGPFILNAGATFTKAEITADALVAATVGNTPKHQADLIFQITPQYETERFTIGANVIGTTSSYAGDDNLLKIPGHALVNGFVQYRLTDQVQLALYANNLFNELAIIETQETAFPATGIVQARTANGRTVSASVRFDF